MSIHFLRPQYLWLLLPLLLLVCGLVFQQTQSAKWQQICDAHLLKFLLLKQPGRAAYWPLVCLALAYILASLAMAGPAYKRLPMPMYQSKMASVVVLDLSPSMLAQDIKPSRAQRAVYKVQDLLAQLSEGQVGMIAFSAQPFVVSPLTQDSATIISMLPELKPEIMPVAGSNIGLALKKAAALMRQAGELRGRIILLSDSPAMDEDFAVVKQLARQGYVTNVLSIGTQKGAPLITENGFAKDAKGNVLIEKSNAKTLSALAKAGHGVFKQFSNDDRDIKALASVTLNQHFFNAQKAMQARSNRWQDEGHWLVLLLLPLMLLVFRRPWLSELSQ
jgi:Ca-activated chloride channel family protein